MDSSAGKNLFRYIYLSNGYSPNYLCNNLSKTDNMVAFIKNDFGSSKIVIYKLSDFENEDI